MLFAKYIISVIVNQLKVVSCSHLQYDESGRAPAKIGFAKSECQRSHLDDLVAHISLNFLPLYCCTRKAMEVYGHLVLMAEKGLGMLCPHVSTAKQTLLSPLWFDKFVMAN